MAHRNRPRSIVRRLFANPVSLGYLGLVAAAGLFSAVDLLVVDRPDASLSAVWVLVATMPTSLAFVPLGQPWLTAGLAVSALLQAAVLGAVYERLTRRGRDTGDL